MKILFLSRWFPFPIDNGSKLRIHQLLAGLSREHKVTLLSFVDPSSFRNEYADQYPHASKIEVVPWKPYDPGSLSAGLGYFRFTPRFIVDTNSPKMENLIRDLISKNGYDLIVASQLSMASYFRCFDGIPAVFEELELGLFYGQVLNAETSFDKLRSSLTWYKLHRYVARILDNFEACTVVSEQEFNLFKDRFPSYAKRLEIIPNCISIDNYKRNKINFFHNQLIFTGSFRYHANYDSMVWFIQDIFPIVLEHLPDTRLVITGDHANLPLPSMKNVSLAGYVDDIKSLIASSCVSLAPLLSGGGTRLKILEAMALGTPVVATSKGAEGLNAVPGKHLLIADTPESFASNVVALLEDDNLRSKLSANGNLFVKENYNWQSVMPRFLQLVEGAVRR